MSLINDALKRAKQSQPPLPPAAASSLQFRAADPMEPRPKRPGWILPGTLTVILIVGAISLWQAYRSHTPALRKSVTTATSLPAAKTEPSAPPSTKAPTPAAAAPKIAPAVPPLHSAFPGASSVAASTVTVQNPMPTNAPATLPRPKPRPLKLQAIVFSPVRPSAIISGKTVFVGDRVGTFTVTRIRPSTATLANETATNVLRLE